MKTINIKNPSKHLRYSFMVFSCSLFGYINSYLVYWASTWKFKLTLDMVKPSIYSAPSWALIINDKTYEDR